MCDKISSAVQLMNEYGKNKIPFLFVIDFEFKDPVVIKAGDINSSGILFNINGNKNCETNTKINNHLKK